MKRFSSMVSFLLQAADFRWVPVGFSKLDGSKSHKAIIYRSIPSHFRPVAIEVIAQVDTGFLALPTDVKSVISATAMIPTFWTHNDSEFRNGDNRGTAMKSKFGRIKHIIYPCILRFVVARKSLQSE